MHLRTQHFFNMQQFLQGCTYEPLLKGMSLQKYVIL